MVFLRLHTDVPITDKGVREFIRNADITDTDSELEERFDPDENLDAYSPTRMDDAEVPEGEVSDSDEERDRDDGENPGGFTSSRRPLDKRQTEILRRAIIQ